MSDAEIKTYSDDSSLKQTCSPCSEHTDGVGTSMLYTYESNAFKHIIIRKHTGVWHMRNCGGHSGYENIRLNFYDGDKPYWLHRLITRLLLGWKWEDRK